MTMTALHDQKSGPAANRHRKPRITLSAKDYERLSFLALAAKRKMPDLAAGLADEIDRAEVVRELERPDQLVSMGCGVVFRDDSTGKSQRVTLVYPEEADISRHKVSVLTPIGTALIGLGVGHSIDWETRSGEIRRLTVLEVHEPQSD